MKVAIYVEDGLTQLVLTPENKWEESVCSSVGEDVGGEVKIMRGSFYPCRGGWIRQSDEPKDDKILIIKVNINPPAK